MVAEYGHAPNRVYEDQEGDFHLNGGQFYDSDENDIAGQINGLTGKAASATFSIAAGGSNQALVTITVVDANGNAVTQPEIIDVWLSDSSAGLGLTATTASGTVGATGSGTDLDAIVAKKLLKSVTTAAGVYVLGITDTANTGFYVVCGVKGLLNVSPQLTSDDY